MHRFERLIFLFVTAFFICGSPLSTVAEPIKGAGCKTEFFLIQDLARGLKKSTGVIVIPQKTGNRVAIKLLAANRIDLAFTCKSQEKLVEKFTISEKTASHWESLVIAHDPIVVLVHRDNVITSLSLKQLSSIFSGAIKNWKEVGGLDTPVQVAYLNKTVESGVLTLFQELVPGPGNGKTGNITLRQDAFRAAVV